MNTTTVKQRRDRIQRYALRNNMGFTLIEALLGFLILAIGMMGIASLQAISLKAGKTSVYTSVAMMKVDELFESMRVNPGELALAAYVAASAGTGADNGCTGTKECTETELAQDDIFWWKKNLTAGLPSGSVKGVVTWVAPVAPSKMAVVTVDVSWQERNKDAAGGVQKTYSTTANICTANPC